MILTLTPNAALDRILFIDEFKPGTTMRPGKMIDKVGGKGLDTSVALSSLGVETLAISFVAGEIGQCLAQMLDEYGIAHDLIWLEGETRLSHIVIETTHHRHSHMIAGNLPISSENAVEFLQRYRTHLSQAAWVVAAGSLPSGAPVSYYRTITKLALEARTPILIDGTGPPVLEAISAGPTVLKMNQVEFCQTFQTSAPTLAELTAQAQVVVERERLSALVMTCGTQGILAFSPDGIFLATSPVQQAVNAAGAGDSASAALAWRLSLNESWSEAVRWAAAVSAAAVLTEGTADLHVADVERILPQTEVKRLN